MYTVYNKETTRILAAGPFKPQHWQSEGAAKAHLTRMAKADPELNKDDYAIAPTREFFDSIEKKETVKNLLSGKDVVQSVNTPACCDPSCETYWSM